MQTHVEIEFKILLTKEIYHQILKDYQQDILQQYYQTNYYLMHPILDNKKYMLRIREKENNYELTLKKPTKDGNLETNSILSKKEAVQILQKNFVDNPIFDTLSTLDIPLSSLDTSHSLQTFRTDIKHPLGVLSIDKNIYENTIDYELEFEVTDFLQGKTAFQTFIKKYDLSYQKNCPSKIKRLKASL